ncbi:thioredoxin [Amycolatopsis sp. NPDC004368]
MSSVPAVTDATFRGEVIESAKPVLVDFWAEWCGPCRAVAPVLEQLAAEHPDEISVVKVNVDENPDAVERYAISSIPTLKVYRGGEVRKTLVGAMPKARLEQELSEFLDA